MLENLLQSSEIFENLRKQSKMAFKIFGKSSGVFGNFWHFRKTSETVQKCFSDVFFLFLENLRKSLECLKIIGKFPDVRSELFIMDRRR